MPFTTSTVIEALDAMKTIQKTHAEQIQKEIRDRSLPLIEIVKARTWSDLDVGSYADEIEHWIKLLRHLATKLFEGHLHSLEYEPSPDCKGVMTISSINVMPYSDNLPLWVLNAPEDNLRQHFVNIADWAASQRAIETSESADESVTIQIILAMGSRGVTTLEHAREVIDQMITHRDEHLSTLIEQERNDARRIEAHRQQMYERYSASIDERPTGG